MLSAVAVDTPKWVLFQVADADSLHHQMRKTRIVGFLLPLLRTSQKMNLLDPDLLQKRQQLMVIRPDLLNPMTIITHTKPPSPLQKRPTHLPGRIRLLHP